MLPAHTDPHLRHHPVATATGRFRTIFLMDTLRTQDTLEMVLRNYLGLFFALRNQDIQYIVLVNFDPNLLQISAQDFESRLRAGLPQSHSLNLEIRTTVDLCRLLREVLPSLSPEDCSTLQFPSLFAQDPFVSLRYPSGFLALLSSIYNSITFSYSFVADAIANGARPDLRFVLPTNYSLTGGNILAQPDWAIIGLDTRALNLSRAFTPALLQAPGDLKVQLDLITQDLCKLLGVSRIFWTGTNFMYPRNPYFQQGTFQPAFHIDYYLTPVGPTQNPDTGAWEELIFVGELFTFNGPTQPDQLMVLEMMEKGLHEAADYFSQLESPAGLPFRVRRIPLLLVGTTPLREIVNKLLSWNQVLVQHTRSEKTIFMPDYVTADGAPQYLEYAAYQKIAIEVYQSEGFAVELVQGRYTDYSFYQGGSLHCMAKVIDREVDFEVQNYSDKGFNFAGTRPPGYH